MTVATVHWHRAVCQRCSYEMRVSANAPDTRRSYCTYCQKCRTDRVFKLRYWYAEERP